ncbi:MAG: phospholipase D-like domain-containing protein [Planctomycetota bacterium]|nr:phospholipase D-like domain-containing protein [Planctomycetota bacterium]
MSEARGGLEQWIDALRASAEDARLSRGERKALGALLGAADLDDHARALLRGEAFRLAREALDSPAASAALDWLGDVLGVIARAGPEVAPLAVESQAWFGPGDQPLRALVQEMRRARLSADICVFILTDDRLSDGLAGLARRGVQVRVITDDAKAGDLGSDVERLRTAGLRVVADASPAHMHHKFCVFDRRRLLTGSFNWTRAATDSNYENLLLTTEPGLVRAFQEEFERLWLKFGG